MRRLALVASVWLAACGGDPAGSAAPANIVISTATITNAISGRETVTVSLENTGGAGSFKVVGTAVDIGSMQNVVVCETDVFDVAAGWTETTTWSCATGAPTNTHRVTAIAALTRVPGTTQYRETSRVNPTLVAH